MADAYISDDMGAMKSFKISAINGKNQRIIGEMVLVNGKPMLVENGHSHLLNPTLVIKSTTSDADFHYNGPMIEVKNPPAN